jgi:hypothetical protein
VMKHGSKHVNCFIRTLNVISEQQEALCYRRECIEQRIMFFNSRFFDRAPCTSVLLLEGKSRALIYLHIFKFLYLAIAHASYLTFKALSLTLNNLHSRRWDPNRRQCLAPNMREYLTCFPWRQNFNPEVNYAPTRISGGGECL